MKTRKHSVYNASRESYLSSGVSVIDTTLEPLKVLRVMIEGLVLNSETGLWLTPLNGIPKVPRLSPFDLIYLDGENRVVHGAELLPGVDFPGFSGKASSALVLPFKTISSSKTRPGDQLALDLVEEVEIEAEPDSAEKAPETLSVEPPAETLPEEPEVVPSHSEDDSPPAEAGIQWLSEELEVEPEEQDDESVISEALRWAQEVEHPPELRPAKTITPPASQSKAPPTEEPAEEIAVEPLRQDDETGLQEAAAPELDTKETKAEPAPPAHAPAKASLPGVAPQRQRPPAPFRASPTAVPEKKRTPTPVKRPPAKSGGAASPPIADPTLQQPAIPLYKEGKAEGTEPPTLDQGTMMTRALRWLFPDMIPPANRRHSVRRHVQELVAYDSATGSLKAHAIWNVSATGVYLATSERWPLGTVIALTLQRKGPPEERTERRVQMRAEAVRWGDEGVGLRFVLPTGMNLRHWEETSNRGAGETEEDHALAQLRLVRAISFVRQICPPVADGVIQLLHKELSNYRVASAVEIALKAEELIAPEPNADGLLAHPAIVLRILEIGSWADLEFIQDYWAGLLAASCSVEGDDVSNLDFVDLLSLLTPIHLRILADACTRATKVTSEQGVTSSYPLYCSAEDLTKVAGTNDLTKIHRAMAQMSDLGLLEKSARSSFVSYAEKAKTTPTSLGLEMFARCLGRKGAV
ncbi:MAG: hypothetical protein WCA11_19250 [Terracidiphilus sp.]